MKNIFQILITTLTLLILSSCGLKGPLYFPSEKQIKSKLIDIFTNNNYIL